MAGRLLDSHQEIVPLPSVERAVKEIALSLERLTRTIDENPSIHHLFSDVELHVARRAVQNYRKLKG